MEDVKRGTGTVALKMLIPLAPELSTVQYVARVMFLIRSLLNEIESGRWDASSGEFCWRPAKLINKIAGRPNPRSAHKTD